MGFTNVDEGSFLYIRSEATRESEWVGKLYPDCAVHLQGAVGEWDSGRIRWSDRICEVASLHGNAAQVKAEELICEAVGKGRRSCKTGGDGIYLCAVKGSGSSSYCRSSSSRSSSQVAAIQAQLPAGQAVVDFACQFIGNPYVWGNKFDKWSRLFRFCTGSVCKFWN